MSRRALSACLLSGVIAGCMQARAPAAQPAVFEAGDAGSHAALQAALQRTLGRDVTLAPDALVNDTQLVIEPVPARTDGRRIDGREMGGRAERFTLWRVGQGCVLRREGSGERIELPGARCLSR
ncbi:MAG: hypothetical protein QM696_05120 [Steroidobacteraceae bacterium]